jgi:hypothetical protein
MLRLTFAGISAAAFDALDSEVNELGTKASSSATVPVLYLNRRRLTTEHLEFAVQTKDCRLIAFLLVYTTVGGARNDLKVGPYISREGGINVVKMWRGFHNGEDFPSAVSSCSLATLL